MYDTYARPEEHKNCGTFYLRSSDGTPALPPDFRHYVTPPYLMITTLRNPLELFVSSQQFSHRAETSTLPEAVEFVAEEMKKRIG